MPRKRQPKSKRPKGKAAVKNINYLPYVPKKILRHDLSTPYNISDQDLFKLRQVFDELAGRSSHINTESEIEETWRLFIDPLKTIYDYNEMYRKLLYVRELSYLYGVDAAFDIEELEWDEGL